MNKYITCLAYILASLFTNISDDVDDRLDLLQCVVVEETQPGDALLEIHLVVDELDRVVVAVCAGNPGLVEADSVILDNRSGFKHILQCLDRVMQSAIRPSAGLRQLGFAFPGL